MDSTKLNAWLQDKRSRNYGALQQHTDIFSSLFSGTTSPEEAAMKLSAHVTTSKQSDTSWRFHQLLFASAAEMTDSHEVLIQLVDVICRLPPRPEKANALDSDLWSAWGDFHSYLWGRRALAANDRDDLRASIDITNAQRAVNLTAFSAKVLGQGIGIGQMGCLAFFDIRDALEPAIDERHPAPHSTLSAEQLTAVDVEVAAQWVRHGEDTILGLSNADLDSTRGMDTRTQAWQGEPGFSGDRWRLWGVNFLEFANSEYGNIGQAAKDAARGAAREIAKGYPA